MDSPASSASEFSAAAAAGIHCVLRLYVAGVTPQSARAIVNIRKLCEDHLAGCHELEIVDIAQDPARAVAAQIIAVPTLVRESPLPARRFLGDLSQTARILSGLGLPAPKPADPA